MATALVNANIDSFLKLDECNPRNLELIVNRHAPFGNQVKDAVDHIPKYELCINQVSSWT